MPKRMLIDATHSEETRVAVIDSHLRLEHLDIVHAGREPLKGNIYLAKVKRIEPSLQAAFVEYGGNRHGFLPFAEIHPDYFRIPIADREALMQRIAEAEARLEQGEDPLAHIQIEDDAFAPGASDQSFDPFQPIVLDGAAAESGRVQLTDGATPQANTSAIVAESDLDENLDVVTDSHDDHDDEDAEDGELELHDDEDIATEAAARSGNYETVGGDEGDMEEMRRRIRRQFLRNYRIQEVIKRGQVMLIQVVKEERGNKGAALTTYMSLAGRYCVLMPNSDKSGGVSRKINNMGDRRRLKDIIDSLEVPHGMSIILRTAGVERSEDEIKRDFDYLVRQWDQIRDNTMASTAPALIYEEANLIKRAIRDYYSKDTDAIVVEGNAGYRLASDFIKLLMPSHENRVVEYTDENLSLFARYQIENQIERLYQPTVQLKSGGYIVINPTEALVAIDVNSGRATRDRHIEETALRTNLEAAEEIARQLRLRDLAGLVVIDFIDMENYRHNHQVERRVKESMRHDRARLQIGRISPFGLLELSRQRLRPSLLETNYEKCDHCGGAGHVRSTDSAALSVIRAIAEEGARQKATELAVHVPTAIATYILNHKRNILEGLERRFGAKVFFKNDDKLAIAEYHIERQTARTEAPLIKVVDVPTNRIYAAHTEEMGLEPLLIDEYSNKSAETGEDLSDEGGEGRGRRSRGSRNRRGGREGGRDNNRDRNRDADGIETANENDSGDEAGEPSEPREPRQPREGQRERGNRERGGRNRGRDRNREPRPPRDAEQPRADGAAPVTAADGAAEQPRPEGDRGPRPDGEKRRRGRRGGRNRNRNGERGSERAPRDPNAPQGEGEQPQREPRQNNNQQQPRQPQAQGMPQGSYAERYAGPKSVYEIDTTPKDPGADGDKPKNGWWRKWTS